MKKLVKALQPPKEPTGEELKAQMPQMTVEQLLGLVWMYDGKNEAETLLRLLAQRLESARELLKAAVRAIDSGRPQNYYLNVMDPEKRTLIADAIERALSK